MSGVSAAGGSLPACLRLISHMAKQNCSGFSFPSCFMSHKFLNLSCCAPRQRIDFSNSLLPTRKAHTTSSGLLSNSGQMLTLSTPSGSLIRLRTRMAGTGGLLSPFTRCSKKRMLSSWVGMFSGYLGGLSFSVLCSCSLVLS